MSLTYSCGSIEEMSKRLSIFKYNTYKILSVIKKESNKIVYHTEDRKKQQYICKVKYKDIITNTELDIYSKLKATPHKHVESIDRIIITNNFVVVVSKYIKGCNLALVIQNRSLVTPYSKIVSDILESIDHVNSLGIIHCDIKPDNIIITRGGDCVLIDFDSARIKDIQPQRSLSGTRFFLPPEISSEEMYSNAADIWSLGVLIVAILSPNKFIDKLKDKKHFFEDLELTSFDIPEKAKRLIEITLQINPKERGTVEEIRSLLNDNTTDPNIFIDNI